jgi:hypothetical protein
MNVLEKEGGDEGNGVNGGDEMDLAEEIVENGRGGEVKEELGRRTAEACERGAFGLPWFVGEFEFSCCDFWVVGLRGENWVGKWANGCCSDE